PVAHGPNSQPAAALTAGGQAIMLRQGRWLLKQAKPSAPCPLEPAGSALVRSRQRRRKDARFWRGSFKLSESGQCFSAQIEGPYGSRRSPIHEKTKCFRHGQVFRDKKIRPVERRPPARRLWLWIMPR